MMIQLRNKSGVINKTYLWKKQECESVYMDKAVN